MGFRVVPKNPAFAGFAMEELKNSQKMKPESPKGDKKSLSEHTNPKRECAEWTGENSVKHYRKKMIVLLSVTGAVYFFCNI